MLSGCSDELMHARAGVFRYVALTRSKKPSNRRSSMRSWAHTGIKGRISGQLSHSRFHWVSTMAGTLSLNEKVLEEELEERKLRREEESEERRSKRAKC